MTHELEPPEMQTHRTQRALLATAQSIDLLDPAQRQLVQAALFNPLFSPQLSPLKRRETLTSPDGNLLQGPRQGRASSTWLTLPHTTDYALAVAEASMLIQHQVAQREALQLRAQQLCNQGREEQEASQQLCSPGGEGQEAGQQLCSQGGEGQEAVQQLCSQGGEGQEAGQQQPAPATTLVTMPGDDVGSSVGKQSSSLPPQLLLPPEGPDEQEAAMWLSPRGSSSILVQLAGLPQQDDLSRVAGLEIGLVGCDAPAPSGWLGSSSDDSILVQLQLLEAVAGLPLAGRPRQLPEVMGAAADHACAQPGLPQSPRQDALPFGPPAITAAQFYKAGRPTPPSLSAAAAAGHTTAAPHTGDERLGRGPGTGQEGSRSSSVADVPGRPWGAAPSPAPTNTNVVAGGMWGPAPHGPHGSTDRQHTSPQQHRPLGADTQAGWDPPIWLGTTAQPAPDASSPATAQPWPHLAATPATTQPAPAHLASHPLLNCGTTHRRRTIDSSGPQAEPSLAFSASTLGSPPSPAHPPRPSSPTHSPLARGWDAASTHPAPGPYPAPSFGGALAGQQLSCQAGRLGRLGQQLLGQGPAGKEQQQGGREGVSTAAAAAAAGRITSEAGTVAQDNSNNRAGSGQGCGQGLKLDAWEGPSPSGKAHGFKPGGQGHSGPSTAKQQSQPAPTALAALPKPEKPAWQSSVTLRPSRQRSPTPLQQDPGHAASSQLPDPHPSSRSPSAPRQARARSLSPFGQQGMGRQAAPSPLNAWQAARDPLMTPLTQSQAWCPAKPQLPPPAQSQPSAASPPPHLQPHSHQGRLQLTYTARAAAKAVSSPGTTPAVAALGPAACHRYSHQGPVADGRGPAALPQLSQQQLEAMLAVVRQAAALRARQGSGAMPPPPCPAAPAGPPVAHDTAAGTASSTATGTAAPLPPLAVYASASAAAPVMAGPLPSAWPSPPPVPSSAAAAATTPGTHLTAVTAAPDAVVVPGLAPAADRAAGVPANSPDTQTIPAAAAMSPGASHLPLPPPSPLPDSVPGILPMTLPFADVETAAAGPSSSAAAALRGEYTYPTDPAPNGAVSQAAMPTADSATPPVPQGPVHPADSLTSWALAPTLSPQLLVQAEEPAPSPPPHPPPPPPPPCLASRHPAHAAPTALPRPPLDPAHSPADAPAAPLPQLLEPCWSALKLSVMPCPLSPHMGPSLTTGLPRHLLAGPAPGWPQLLPPPHPPRCHRPSSINTTEPLPYPSSPGVTTNTLPAVHPGHSPQLSAASWGTAAPAAVRGSWQQEGAGLKASTQALDRLALLRASTQSFHSPDRAGLFDRAAALRASSVSRGSLRDRLPPSARVAPFPMLDDSPAADLGLEVAPSIQQISALDLTVANTLHRCHLCQPIK
ncbi:hypothetical protein V8C86DRAFT_3086375 [Haematococcus lacustris]